MATMARESTGKSQSSSECRWEAERGRRWGAARLAGAHEALPHTRPGGKPPETPGPLSLEKHYSERREAVKGSQAARRQRALDSVPPFRGADRDKGKGANERRSIAFLPRTQNLTMT